MTILIGSVFFQAHGEWTPHSVFADIEEIDYHERSWRNDIIDPYSYFVGNLHGEWFDNKTAILNFTGSQMYIENVTVSEVIVSFINERGYTRNETLIYTEWSLHLNNGYFYIFMDLSEYY